MKRNICLIIICFSTQWLNITGEVMLVRPGDDVTLRCTEAFEESMWFSHRRDQSPVVISVSKIPNGLIDIYRNRTYPQKFITVENSSSNTVNLEIKNLTVEDTQASYYCGGIHEIKMVFGDSFTLKFPGQRQEHPEFPLYLFLLPQCVMLFVIVSAYLYYVKCVSPQQQDYTERQPGRHRVNRHAVC